MALTREQYKHIRDLAIAFTSRLNTKYRAGVAEHGGDIRDNGPTALIDMAIDELVDAFVYMMSVREKLLAAEVPTYATPDIIDVEATIARSTSGRNPPVRVEEDIEAEPK